MGINIIYNVESQLFLIFKQYVNAGDKTEKSTLHCEFKTLKNEITLLIRSGKKKYYDNYFSKNKDDLTENMAGDQRNHQYQKQKH